MQNSTSVPDLPETKSEKEIPVVPLVGIILLQAVGTVIGNLLVCIAVYIQPALHHVTFRPIFSLALADLMAGLVAMPSYVAKKFIVDGPFSRFVCDAFRFSYFISGYASILSLCVISVERLLAIKSPLTYMTTVTHKRVVVALAFIWVDSIAVSLLPFIPLTGGYSEECNYNPASWWSIMVITSNVIVPFLFIVVCYAYIYLIARTHLKRINSERRSIRESLQPKEDGAKRQERRKERRESKANKTIMIVIGLFVVCWFPSSLYYFLQQVCPWCFPPSFASKKGLVNALVKVLTFTSSFCNPIIYCWRSRDFRKAFIKILFRKTQNLAESFRSRSRSSTNTGVELTKKNTQNTESNSVKTKGETAKESDQNPETDKTDHKNEFNTIGETADKTDSSMESLVGKTADQTDFSMESRAGKTADQTKSSMESRAGKTTDEKN